MDFNEFLSDKRKAVATPDNVIDELGNCHFGTFDKEFKNMDFLKVNRPSRLPNLFNKAKLTLWEATEIHMGDLVLLTAVCDMALFGTALTVVYDKRTKKCTSWQEMMIPSSKAEIAPNLLNGSETVSHGKKEVASVLALTGFLQICKGRLHGGKRLLILHGPSLD